MLRSAAGKAAWVGRTAAMVFGLALVMALVLGVATMALAAVPGDPFRLGKFNTIDRMSTLVGTATSPMLKVENKGTGTALNLKVQDGKPPLKVTSDGRVPRLNADKLDGKHAGAFLPKGATAADSEKLAGKDPSAFLGADQKAADSEKLGGKEASEFAKAYKRTVVVSPTGTDTQNGSALLDALSGIQDASETTPYLLYIEPGTYNLGNRSLQMKQHVDIEGAGKLRTIISRSVDDGVCTTGTVAGSNNAGLRLLTVRNTGTGFCSVGIYNANASPRLTQITVESTGGGGFQHHGVLNDNASPTMTNVTATASGGDHNYGVNSISSSPTIRNSRLSGTSNSLVQNGGTAKVALTQLVGPIAKGTGTIQCFNNFDQNLQPVTCP